MLLTTALDDSDESPLNDSDASSDNNVQAQVFMAMPNAAEEDIHGYI